jgi:hypothetical protein
VLVVEENQMAKTKPFRWTAEAQRYRALIEAGRKQGRNDQDTWGHVERGYRDQMKAQRPSEVAMLLSRERALFDEVAGRVEK